MVGGAGSKLGTGGMITKLKAAKIVTEKGIDMVIANSNDPEILYDIVDGKAVGMILYSYFYWASDGQVLWISQMYIEEEYRKYGIFFKLIKKLREEKNYTQASIAKLLEISPGQLGNIESIKQEHKFTLAQILRICDELNISIESIFLPGKEDVETREVIKAIVKYQEGI